MHSSRNKITLATSHVQLPHLCNLGLAKELRGCQVCGLPDTWEKREGRRKGNCDPTTCLRVASRIVGGGGDRRGNYEWANWPIIRENRGGGCQSVHSSLHR